MAGERCGVTVKMRIGVVDNGYGVRKAEWCGMGIEVILVIMKELTARAYVYPGESMYRRWKTLVSRMKI